MRRITEEYPNDCYLDPGKKRTKFIPEKKIEMAQFNERVWRAKFPQTKKKIAMNKLKLTNLGLYSMASPEISDSLIDLIKEFTFRQKFEKPLVITETNGGVGGFSIKLAQNFPILNIVEIEPIHAKIIENNLRVYGCSSRIKIYIQDYLEIMDKLKSDIIICDPPWGGRGYRKNPTIKLGFDNIDISCIINHLIKKKLTKLFILLAPINYDIHAFLEKIIARDVTIRKAGKHYFICVQM